MLLATPTAGHARHTDVLTGRLRTLDHDVAGFVEPLGAVGTDVYVVTTAAPHGPRGLWRSLARTCGAPVDPVDADRAEGAHLAYLASLG